ncbi:MAG: Protein containing GCN5-related N-acetyltransferase domain protein [Schlesneria sp.]|nr:Protein containing GCN5-related N-acetyltransferase domain protein [Schlesneria sp.]
MSESLTKRRFSANDADLVAHFECGDQPWELAQSLWIRGPGVIRSMAERQTEVWLYFNTAGHLVGFGALGQSRRPHPPDSKNYTKFSVIPSLAVQRDLWGKPEEGDKYSTQILDDLFLQAELHGTEFLILDVHVNNDRALAFYRDYGFTEYFDHVKDDHRRLVARLR